MRALYHPSKPSIIVNSLSQSSISSFVHVENENKELVKGVPRLPHFGVWLDQSNKGGVFIHNGSMSSFVVAEKEK